MTRPLMHAVALLCALALSLICLVLTHPTPAEFCGEVLAIGFLGVGLCLGRTRPLALPASLLAASGLLMVVFCAPADAATVAHKVLGVIEAPVQPLALAAPSAPPAIHVTVAAADAADKSVAIPLGQWLSLIQGTLGTVLMGLLGMALTKLPAPLAWAIKAYGEDKIVQQAISLAINAVPGAAKGEPLTVEVANPVLAHGLQWVTDNVPTFAVKMMGGEDAIKAKLFAALHLEPSASAAALGVKATA